MFKLTKVFIALFISSLFYLPNVFAANTKFVKVGGDVTFSISKNEPNRIAILDDRITKFIKLSGSFIETNDGVSGDIFITPSEDNSSPVLSGFLTTEKGNSIQVRLLPKNIPSTNTELSIKAFGKESDKAAEWERSFDSHRLAALQLARTFGNNGVVPGYTTKRYEKGITITAKSFGNLTARINSISLGSLFIAEKLSVINVTKKEHFLTERMFNDKHVIGVWIEGATGRANAKDDSFYLSPNESITVIRVRRNLL